MRKPPGNDLNLGYVVGRRARLGLSRSQRDKHLYVCGSTGTGKSKFLEHLIRQDIIAWRKSKCGLIVIDPHGALYDSLMRWLAWHDIQRPIIPIDLRRGDRVLAYNLLRKRANGDPGVIVRNFVQAMAHVWGEMGTERTPLFNRWATNVLRTLYEKEHTLVESEYLTDRVAKNARYHIAEGIENRATRNDWLFADTLSPKEFDQQIGSTINRFYTFLGIEMLRLMFGQAKQSLDLGAALKEGHIILVNLSTEGELVSEEDTALFATLLLTDLWTAARGRGKGTPSNPVKPFYVYIDEFQNFVTPTIAKDLDQARGFGLHLTLAHQFPRQLHHAGAHGLQVYDSVLVNARTKIVFQVEGEENLRPLAQALYSGVMDPNKVKHALYSTKVMDYREEYRTSYSRATSRARGRAHSDGSASGEGVGTTEFDSFDDSSPFSVSSSQHSFASASSSDVESESEGSSTGETETPMLIPVMGKELAHVQFESLDEQLFRAMAVLFDQKQRQAVARVAEARAPMSIHTPFVKDVPSNEERVKRYTNKLNEQWEFMLTRDKAQEQLDNRKTKIERAIEKATDSGPKSAKRRLR